MLYNFNKSTKANPKTGKFEIVPETTAGKGVSLRAEDNITKQKLLFEPQFQQIKTHSHKNPKIKYKYAENETDFEPSLLSHLKRQSNLPEELREIQHYYPKDLLGIDKDYISELLPYHNMATPQAQFIFDNYAKAMLRKRNYLWYDMPFRYDNYGFLAMKHPNDNSFLIGFQDTPDSIFHPSHFSPVSLRSGFELIKQSADAETPIIFTVTPDLTSQLEKVGYKKINEIPSFFAGKNIMKDVVVNPSTRKQHLFNEIKKRESDADFFSPFNNQEFLDKLYSEIENADISWQKSTNISGATPWTKLNAQQAADYTTTFFINDVVPRLKKNRTNLIGTRFVDNSPFLGRFSIGKIPSETAPEITTPIIKNGNYTVTMNENDMRSLNDKIASLIHGMRHDMSNYHKGLYDEKMQMLMKEEQKYYNSFNDAIINGDDVLAKEYEKYLDQVKLLENMAKERGLISDAVTSEEMDILNKAYRTPKVKLFKDSEHIDEKISENTRFRFQISHRNGDVVGKELDKIIDNMSEDEIIDILTTGDSYGLDYVQYIKEHPDEKSQIINNIKNALKKVGIATGVATGLEGIIFQGKLINTNNNDDQ